jgi:DNA-binding transcriptional ArsR family regulator
MPVYSSDLLQPDSQKSVSIALEPAHNVQHTLKLLGLSEETSGLDEWIYRTTAAMSLDERARNRLVMIGLYYATLPGVSYPSFPLFVEHLANESPIILRNRILDAYIEIVRIKDGKNPIPEYGDILSDVNAFLAFLRRGFDDEHLDPAVERQAYTYLIDPPAMQQLIVEHLRSMWYKYIAVEWERVRPMLQKAVRAFETIDLTAMDRREAIEYVIGRPISDDKWCHLRDEHEQVIFVPSAHIGPYTQWVTSGHRAWIIFGARLPEGALEDVPELSRAELLVRLNALADDTRLSMLKLVADQGELRSQDIMHLLDLSQSGASRHLQQLTAAGFLTERRCSGAKCYTMNTARLDATLQALGNFLSPASAAAGNLSHGTARLALLGKRVMR